MVGIFTTEVIIVALYMLIVLGIGVYFYDRRESDDFWRAGGQISTVVNSIALFAALASGGAFLGALGVAYSLGAPFIWSLAAGGTFGVLIGSILVGKPLREVGAYTITDIFNVIYNDRRINTLAPIIVVIGFTIYVIAQLVAAGIVTDFLLPVEYETAVVLAGIVFLAYVALGGMWAITVTDFFQGALMGLLGLLVAAFSVAHFGGSVSAPLTETPRIGEMAPLPTTSYLGFFLIWLAVSPVIPHVLMRVFSSESANSARRSLAWLAFLFGTYTVVSFYIVAAAAISINPDLAQPDFALIIVMENVLPVAITGVLAAAILAAVMSTTDALLLSISASVSNDIYKLVINPDASEKRVVRIGTAAIVIAGLFSIGIAALDPPDLLVALFTDAMGFMGSALAFPLILGVWWRRTTTNGALAGIIVGAVSYVILWPFVPMFNAIIVSLPLSLIVTVGVSLVDSPPTQEELHRRHTKFKHQ